MGTGGAKLKAAEADERRDWFQHQTFRPGEDRPRCARCGRYKRAKLQLTDLLAIKVKGASRFNGFFVDQYAPLFIDSNTHNAPSFVCNRGEMLWSDPNLDHFRSR
jgi:hypothetical protein